MTTTCNIVKKTAEYEVYQYFEDNIILQIVYMFFLKHSVFQSEARICLSFSEIQPQNMLKICLSKNIQKSKFHGLTYAWGEWVVKGYQNEENFEICTFYIAKITNLGRHLGQ